MRHHLNIIASNYNLDKEKFTEFALRKENYNKYGIVNETGFITTSTFFSDSLVRDFKKENKLK